MEYETGVRGAEPRRNVSVPNDLAQTVLPVLVGPQRIRLLRLCPPPLSPIVAWLFHSAILGPVRSVKVGDSYGCGRTP